MLTRTANSPNDARATSAALSARYIQSRFEAGITEIHVVVTDETDVCERGNRGRFPTRSYPREDGLELIKSLVGNLGHGEQKRLGRPAWAGKVHSVTLGVTANDVAVQVCPAPRDGLHAIIVPAMRFRSHGCCRASSARSEALEAGVRLDWTVLPSLHADDGWSVDKHGVLGFDGNCAIDPRFSHNAAPVRHLGGEVLAERIIDAVRKECAEASASCTGGLVVDGILVRYGFDPKESAVDILEAELVAPSPHIPQPLMDFFIEVWRRRAVYANAVLDELVNGSASCKG